MAEAQVGRIVLISHSGHGNLGDAAILDTAIGQAEPLPQMYLSRMLGSKR